MMKVFVYTTFIMLLVLFVEQNRTNAQVEFRLVQKFMIIVSVTVNDMERFDFLLDTGTNSTIMTPEAAQKLNLRPRDRMEMITVAGKQIVPRAFLPTIALGTKKAENVEVLLADLPALRAIDKNICGILGQNFLAQFNYLLDYDHRQIFFDDNGELEKRLRGKRLSIVSNENKLLIPVSVKQNIRRLVLDSAASNLILFGDMPHRLDIERTSFAKLSTNAGNSPAQITKMDFLQIGDETFYDLPVIFIGEKGEPRMEDGLLPLCLFRSVYFNNKSAYTIFNARSRK